MNTTMIQWNATRDEDGKILKVAQRTEKILCSCGGVDYPRFQILMDLEACHCNGMPLDFDKLLAFPDFDFAHDVFGIRRHINRETGKIEDCFVPRCAKP
jgi:hypothetical protein